MLIVSGSADSICCARSTMYLTLRPRGAGIGMRISRMARECVRRDVDQNVSGTSLVISPDHEQMDERRIRRMFANRRRASCQKRKH
jgi:hypothetical protein